MTECIVYQIVNVINCKRYVGSSVNVDERWKVHLRCLRKGIHVSSKLQRAWNKYGEDNFFFIILEYCDVSERNYIEQYWINDLDSYHNGYNCVPKVGSPANSVPWNYRKRLTKKHKQNLSIAHKGKIFTKERNQRISESLKGENNHFFGKKHSIETKEKMRKAKLGKKRGPYKTKPTRERNSKGQFI